MSLIAVALQGLLAVLLLVALVFGWRLERKLKALRDAQSGFAKAVADLDGAAQRAEQGLADLRAATDEASERLADRIDKAKALAAQLDERMSRAAAPPSEPRRDSARPAREPRDFAAPDAAETAAPPSLAPGRRLNAQDFEAMLEREARARAATPATSRPATSSRPSPMSSASTSSSAPARETPRSRARVDDDLFDGPDPVSRPGSPFRDHR